MSPKKKLGKNSFVFELGKFLKLYEVYKKDYFAGKKKGNRRFKEAKDFWRDLENFMEGGKKLRGFLVYFGYLAAGGRDIKKILPVCLAYEIVHSFLLIHDDVIDKSDLRRGKPAIHKIYAKAHGEHFGESMAIIWGDIAAFEAVSLVNSADFDSNLRQQAIHFFVETVIETGYGETLDVLNSYENPKEADIRTVNLLKTAKYSVVGPLTIGSILAGANKMQIASVEKFGLVVGEAYQLRDDLLGVFGDEKTVGKSTLSDMREGKNTLLIYKTKEMAEKADRMEIDRLWGSENAKISDLELIREIIKKSGAYDWYINKMLQLKNRAIAEIRGTKMPANLKNVIIELCEYIIKRDI